MPPPPEGPWLVNKHSHTRRGGGGLRVGRGVYQCGILLGYGREVISHMYIYPWTIDRYGEPTFDPGIKESHRILSTCLINVITHTVALCTRAQ